MSRVCANSAPVREKQQPGDSGTRLPLVGQAEAGSDPSVPGSKQDVDSEAPSRRPYHAIVIMVVALVGALLLGGLAVFQLLLIAGAPLGRFAWGGQNVVLPARLRIGSAVSVALYAVFAVLMLQAAGTFTVFPHRAAAVGIWVLAGYFVLGVGMNAASRSRPERLVMTPVALTLAVACVALALQ